MMKNLMVIMFCLVIALAPGAAFSQNGVTAGIHYQAVARDNSGKELYHKAIDVKFSIISETPIGEVVYQELHSHITTSKYGVFSLVIGKGTQTGGIFATLSEVDWSKSDHFLKVEVKFENDFIDMGTMQFLAVPYALYAQKSLEPGPPGLQGNPGPKGDPGDPASDNQTLSFDESTLTVSGGNSVPMTSLLQNLTITDGVEGKYLGISRGNSVLLSTAEADADPFNEIQDLNLSGNKMTITKNSNPTEINLTPYLDNTDNQQLSYDQLTRTLSLTNGGSVNLGNIVAFRTKKLVSSPTTTYLDVTYIPESVEYNIGNAFNEGTGEFNAPVSGIYTFNISYFAEGSGSSRKLTILYNSGVYEDLAIDITPYTLTTRSITMKLNELDVVKFVIFTGGSTQTGTGSFSGYRVY